MADAKQNATSELQKIDEASFDYDKLEAELGEDLADLEQLKADELKIGNPESLADAVNDAVWDQFMQQIGAVAGEDFIKDNHCKKLNLRDRAHIQTTENYKKGKIADHNTEIDYQRRYDNWQAKFERDENGNIKTHTTRTGKEEANLVKGARKPFDKGRPKGSAEKHTDMDHTISAAEIIRDPAINAHMTEEEQIAFANSDANLNEIDASLNRSKGDKPMTDWLNHKNSRGQTPEEIFNISTKQKEKLIQKDINGRRKLRENVGEGEKRSISTGKKSQWGEAFRIGGKTIRAVVLALLAQLGRNIIQKLIAWLVSGEKSISAFLQTVKEAIQKFVKELKQNVLSALKSSAMTIATAIFGTINDYIQKAVLFVMQGIRSVKETIQYFRDPENKKKPFNIQILEVSKIVTVGLAGVSAITLGEVIATQLKSTFLDIPIPLLGSLASIIGMFLGGVVAGIGGAVVLHLIDKLLAKKLKAENTKQQIDKGNHILSIQGKQIVILGTQLQDGKQRVVTNIRERHQAAAGTVKASVQNIFSAEQDIASVGQEIREIGQRINDASQEEQEDQFDNAEKIKKINEMLDSL